jgi:hypothetical protein
MTTTAATAAILLVCALGMSACARGDVTVPPGTPIHHDDFDYSVQGVERLDRIGDRHATGVFLVVSFRVENHARRVAHRWGNDIAYVVDASRREYSNDPAAQETLARLEPFDWKRDGYTTPAGAVETTRLVFDVPKAGTAPYLKVRGAFLMGDLFDGHQFTRKKVRLF